MKRSVTLAAVFAVALFTATAEGNPPCGYAAPTYQAQTYATAATYVQTVPVYPAIFVPSPTFTVGAAYTGGDGEALGSKLDLILRRLDALEQSSPANPQAPRAVAPRVVPKPAPKVQPPPIPPGVDARLDVSTVLSNGCAKCHSAPADKGGGFVLFPSNLTPQVKQKVLAAVLSGKMPPGKPLAAVETAAILSAFVQQ